MEFLNMQSDCTFGGFNSKKKAMDWTSHKFEETTNEGGCKYDFGEKCCKHP